LLQRKMVYADCPSDVRHSGIPDAPAQQFRAKKIKSRGNLPDPANPAGRTGQIDKNPPFLANRSSMARA
jgi:hypothetical protein